MKLLLNSLILFVIFCNAKGLIKIPPNETITAVIIFGDSIVDTGNNNHLATIAKCNFPPYGKDFPGQIPTGRFGNGKVPPDLIGGAGYDPLTSSSAPALSLLDQIELFKEYISKLRGIVGEERANFIVAKSLFLVVAGSNDISNTYFLAGARRLQYDVASYTELMANNAAKFLNEIYGIGARRIGVLSAPPIGCVPSQRTIAGGIQRECVEKYNDAAKLFNAKLFSQIDSLNTNLPNSRIVYLDVYNPLLDLIQNPTKYGFEVANKGCCGTGKIEVTLLCNPSTPTCPDSSEYVFWDSFHPTEAAYRTLIPPILQKFSNSFF